MTGMTVAQAIQLGWQHQQAGRLDQAEAICRQVLAQNPQNAEALHLLGIIAIRSGRADAAVDLLGRAIALQPNYVSAHNNLGIVLSGLGRIDQAIACHQRAIQIHPDFPEAHCNLGNCFWQQHRLDEAGACYRRAIGLNPNYADAYIGLGNVFKETGQLDESIAACRTAIRLNPAFAGAYKNLGNVLHLKGTDQLDQVMAAYQRAIQLDPNDAKTHCDLGSALADQSRYDEAITSYQRSLQLNPGYAPALGYMGSALAEQGRLDEAVEACRSAIRMQPGHSWMHGNLLYAMYHDPDCDAHQLLNATRDWARTCTQVPAARSAADRSPSRRLKIGYLSPFFFRCADAHYIVPLLAHHDAGQFEIFCYSRIAAASLERSYFPCHHFHDITYLGPQGAADLIRGHKIDILVSICRPADEFLRVLTHRPAPVQMIWLTFASATTGMEEVVDYRISDPLIDPAGSDEACYTEKTLRLPETAWCYDPMLEAPPVGPLPALANHHITFGAFNRWCKINPSVLSAWAGVLQAVPNSRLQILSVPGGHRQRVVDAMEKLHIDPSRLEFIPRTSRYEYLKLYNRVDLTLDTFPFSGHTTALDSLWMGVPVVTLSGRTCVGRAAAGALTNLGLTEWIAKSPDEFISIAAKFSQDHANLSQLRAGLRQKFQSSALGDGKRFTRQMESLYRQAWQQSCDGEIRTSPVAASPPRT